MTKSEARAILACQKAVYKALDICENKLTGDELAYAQSYWMAHIRQSFDGHSYGGAPVVRAGRILGDDQE
jgi:hypothetical protein